jgi:tight adherence protein B
MLLSVILVVALVVAGSAALVGAVMMGRAAQKVLTQRLSLVAATPRAAALLDSKRAKQSAMLALNVRVRRVFTVGSRYRWGMHATMLTLMPGALVSATVAWLVARSFLGMAIWIAAAASAAALFMVPRMLLRRQQSKSEQKFMNLFPDTIDMIVRMLRAGVPVTTTIRMVSRDAPPPVDAVFGALANQVDIGIPFDQALNIMGEQIGLPDFRFFAVAVSLQLATGGNLASTLDILSDIIRKRRALRLKAKATTAEARLSAYVLSAIPFVVIAALLLTNPDYLAPLITDPRGHLIAGAALGGLLLGFATMRQMMRRATAL